MAPASLQSLIARMRELGPFVDDAATSAALFATLEALGALLTPDEQALVAEHAPDEVAQALRRVTPLAKRSDLDLFRRVARREGIRVALAVEHAEIACRALAESCGFAARRRLQRHLPELAHLFDLPSPSEAPAPMTRVPPIAPRDLAEWHTLATGRPGARRPLSTFH